MEIFIDCEEELRGEKIKDGRKTNGYFAQDEVPRAGGTAWNPGDLPENPLFLVTPGQFQAPNSPF